MSEPFAEGWKFRTVDQNTLSIFINRKLWFSNPSLFNDPFDCNFDIDAIFDAVRPSLDIKDPEELHEALAALKRNDTEYTHGYLCLCKEWKHTLMWSHYANEHKGIVLGFSFDGSSLIKPTEIEVQDICYNSRSLEAAISRFNNCYNLMASNPHNTPGLSRSETNEFYSNFFKAWVDLNEAMRFTKAECWHYEKEQRYEIEIDHGVNGEARAFSPTDLKHIIFGLNCQERDKETILNLLASDEWKHVKFWQATKDSVNLVIQAIQHEF